jgi:AAA family ATPase
LDSQLDQIREIVDLSLNQPEKFLRHGLSPPKGLLLNGPAGTGKTLIAKAVASETNAHVIIINGPEVISQFYGETERLLKDYFLEAIENQPSIIFIDEIDSLCPKRDSSNNELEKRVVTCLLTLMDGVDQNTHNRLVVIGATNRIDSIDSALRRPGRFDREFEIGIPNSKQRFDILKKLCAGLNHCLSDEDIEQVASMAHGYVGADLAGVCREGGLYTLKRSRDLNVEDDVLSTDPEFLITKEDLIFGLSKVGPSVIREVVLDVPKVYWDDIGGQSDIKQRLKEAVEWPLKHPEHFRKFNIKPPKGLLLYGPPGCSKTLMAKALATEAGLNFLAVKGPEVKND